MIQTFILSSLQVCLSSPFYLYPERFVSQNFETIFSIAEFSEPLEQRTRRTSLNYIDDYVTVYLLRLHDPLDSYGYDNGICTRKLDTVSIALVVDTQGKKYLAIFN